MLSLQTRTVKESVSDPVNHSLFAGLAPNTIRAYEARLSRFRQWLGQDRWLSSVRLVNRSIVKSYLRSLEASGASPQVLNGVLAAIKYTSYEAHESGLVDSTTYAGVRSIRTRKLTGIRAGKWLSAAQCAALIAALRRESALSLAGSRDAALIALLLGCGLRRQEACALTLEQVRTIEGRMMLVNIKGKGGRLRTVSVPPWAKIMIEDWMSRVNPPYL